MRYRREDIVGRALQVLDEVGLPDLTMRRLAAELGVQPSALYHHFPDKQTLLAAVADRILDARDPVPATGSWIDRTRALSRAWRAALVAHTDGAELVASMSAFGLAGAQAYDDLAAAVRAGGASDADAALAARTLVHFVNGHAVDEQTHQQLARFGQTSRREIAGDFDAGLELVLAGIAARVVPGPD